MYNINLESTTESEAINSVHDIYRSSDEKEFDICVKDDKFTLNIHKNGSTSITLEYAVGGAHRRRSASSVPTWYLGVLIRLLYNTRLDELDLLWDTIIVQLNIYND